MTLEINTPEGPARAHLRRADNPVGALALGHGAGGSVDAPDLARATEVAVDAGYTTVLVEQPYRVAGRRSSPPGPRLDSAWLAVMEHLRAAELEGLPLIVGGRSAGARVACRTAGETGAKRVLCLAFPLHPPGKPEKSRADELDAVAIPTLVIQGKSDPFGMPSGGKERDVVVVPGNHSLKAGLDEAAAAIADWLRR